MERLSADWPAAVVAPQSAPWLELAPGRSSQAKVGVVAVAIIGGMATATIMAVAADGTGFPIDIAERLRRMRPKLERMPRRAC